MPSPSPISNKSSPDPGAQSEQHPLKRASSDESCQSMNLEIGSTTGGQSPVSCVAGALPVIIDNAASIRKREALCLQDVKPVSLVDLGDFYPDGGWGWIVLGAATLVHMMCNGFHLAYGTLFLEIKKKFTITDLSTAWLGSLGIAISLFTAPIVTIICRRKSPRLFAVIGGLICALGCLFLAFSDQQEQLYTSHCVVLSLGTGLTIVTANIMVGRYFRKKRELAEMILVSGSGIGTALMATMFKHLIRAIDWMHGLECVAGLLVLTILAGAMYRSANLYHPRRKVILHLKSQKKSRRERESEKPPYLDFSALRMRSLRALIVISAVIAIGIHVPFVLLVSTASAQSAPNQTEHYFLLSVYMGIGFVIGCVGLSYITIRNSTECYIARRHLCQTSALLCGLFTLLLILATNESSHILYAWAYGICCGSYYYSLKTYVYELVKIKLMERAWSFLSAANSFPMLFGAPVAAYLNESYKSNVAGYILAGVAMIVGGLMFYIMPFFERHPSNQEVLQKHSSCQYNAHITEAAALLDIDFSEGCPAGKHNHQTNNGHAPFKLTRQCIPGSNNKTEGGGVRVQLQCFVQHKEREKPKQATLTKIAEEKDAMKNNGSTTELLKKGGGGNSSNQIELSITKADYSDYLSDGPSDNNFSNATEKSSSKDNAERGHGKLEGKKSKKNDVRIDLFDPPSQEKESTATVSYDSDLYINLCEAQV
ncbi:monocarboxylate transporter 2 [Biomphalaria glabrata]|nr:monocarboxylate transporter 2-like [Biomphalaria glabrata]